ncbi:hypothetical protein ACFSAG_07395 [Sphingorhabdus buctiana]|uniref:Uncharacterized protein n=1 Tax=Sphingorhabdus buctiana TaxID=1508805 RepID=A0ABW4MCZ4_9SPHN
MSLTLSCCVNGLFAALVAAVLTTYAADEIFQSNLSEKAWLAATLAAFGLPIAVSVWAIIGIWRSAVRHQATAGTIKSALIAKLFASMGALGLVAHLSQTPPPIIENALVVGGIYPFGLPAELSVDGRTLHIDGSITVEVVEQFKELIGKHPEVNQVSLTSPGGSIDAAVEISSIIKERNLSTVADGECSSACTMIFLSSKVRAFDVDASLGFHSPSGGGYGDDVVVNGTSLEIRLAYADAGLSEPFADKVFGTPSNSMWHPIDYVLIREGAVNLFTKARIIQDHEESIKSFNETKPLKIDEFMSVVSAKRDNTNLTYTHMFSLREDEIDWAAMSEEIADNADELICGDAISNLMVKSGAIYTYLYVDKIGKKVGMVKIEKCPIRPNS